MHSYRINISVTVCTLVLRIRITTLMRIRILVYTLMPVRIRMLWWGSGPFLSIWCCSGSGYGSRSYNSLLQIWTLQCSKITLSKASTFSLWCGLGIRIQLSTLMRIRIQLPKLRWIRIQHPKLRWIRIQLPKLRWIRIQLPKLRWIRTTIVHCTIKDDTKPGLWYRTFKRDFPPVNQERRCPPPPHRVANPDPYGFWSRSDP